MKDSVATNVSHTRSSRMAVRQSAETRHPTQLEFRPAVAALLTEGATAGTCLDVAEELGAAVGRNMAAIHVGVDPATSEVPDQEVDLQLRRELCEGTAQDRFEHIRGEFSRWRNADPERRRVDWRDCPGDVAECIRRECGNLDLIALSCPGNLDGRDALEFALFHSGKLVAVAPREPLPSRILRHVLVVWQPRVNAYATAAAASPWLRKAENITVLCINDRKDQTYQKSAEEMFSSLAVRFNIRSIVSKDISVGKALLRQTAELNASCLMLGAYCYGPLLDLFLGHVTRYALTHTTVPLLMKHQS